eukprot:10367904-Alexandrium_andersonii.AAC.1
MYDVRSGDRALRRRTAARRPRDNSRRTFAHAQLCSTPKPAAAVSAPAGQQGCRAEIRRPYGNRH